MVQGKEVIGSLEPLVNIPTKLNTVYGYASGSDAKQKTFTLTFNSGENTKLLIDCILSINNNLTSATVTLNGETKTMEIYQADWQMATQQFILDCTKNTDYDVVFVANFSSNNSVRGFINIFKF